MSTHVASGCTGAMTLRIILVLATVAAGLQAGSYYVWACGVLPGLRRVDDDTFVGVVAQVNQAIVNPVFLVTFLGAPVLTGSALALGAPRGWAVTGLALTLLTVAITVAGNVPLNDALARDAADPTTARTTFETAWQRWNLARTLTSAGALAALAAAALHS